MVIKSLSGSIADPRALNSKIAFVACGEHAGNRDHVSLYVRTSVRTAPTISI